ncbi:unnamed protein product [Cochlearia groenlandica]
MFPSLDTNGYDLFDPFNPYQTTMLPSFTTHIQSPNPHDYIHPLFSPPFSSYFIDDSFLINQQNQEVVESPIKICKKLEQKINNEKFVDGNTSEKVRKGKKRDRHSKICTAQGPRDRRMRLSLQIARKFFGLQDMLGFDKASKTIEWLISKSKDSIKQVKESVDTPKEVVGGDHEHLQVSEKAKDETLMMKVPKVRRTKIVESSCKKKESREKARERARERTMMKMRLSHPNQESRKIKITGGAHVLEEEFQEQDKWSNNTNVNMVNNQMDPVSIIEKYLGLTNDSSSSSIFGFSEEAYTSLDSIRGTNTIEGMVTPKENNTTSIASVDEERNTISSFSIYDYLCC